MGLAAGSCSHDAWQRPALEKSRGMPVPWATRIVVKVDLRLFVFVSVGMYGPVGMYGRVGGWMNDGWMDGCIYVSMFHYVSMYLSMYVFFCMSLQVEFHLLALHSRNNTAAPLQTWGFRFANSSRFDSVCALGYISPCWSFDIKQDL